MHPPVKNTFMAFTESFEGGAAIDWMFLDVLGRVGTAFGIDLDFNGSGPSPSVEISRQQGLPKAKALQWVFRNTSRSADDNAVALEWETIKSKPSGPQYGAGWFKQFTKLQLTRASMVDRVQSLLTSNERVLKASPAFKDFEQWPADGQLAVLGLSWNGVGHLTGNTQGTLQNPRAFRDACEKQDFLAAAALSKMVASATNDSIRRRSEAQRQLLLNAAAVVEAETYTRVIYQRPVLYYPTILTSPLLWGLGKRLERDFGVVLNGLRIP